MEGDGPSSRAYLPELQAKLCGGGLRRENSSAPSGSRRGTASKARQGRPPETSARVDTTSKVPQVRPLETAARVGTAWELRQDRPLETSSRLRTITPASEPPPNSPESAGSRLRGPIVGRSEHGTGPPSEPR